MKTPYQTSDGKLTEITWTDYHPGDQVELAPYTDNRKSGKVLQVDRMARRVGLETETSIGVYWVPMSEVRPWDYQRHIWLEKFNAGLEAAEEIQKFSHAVSWSQTTEPYEYKERGYLTMRGRPILGYLYLSCGMVYLSDDGSLRIGNAEYPANVARVMGRAIYWLLESYRGSVDLGEYKLEATRYGVKDGKTGLCLSWDETRHLHDALEHSNINNLSAKNIGDGRIAVD